jgi:large subunit ribosomal protein L15
MKLSNLKPADGATRERKRVGRGPGSGRGSTSTRGHKGQKSRSGYSSKPWFEGGQMPLQRRTPKRGFTNIHREPVEAVNVRDLGGLEGETITAELLKQHGLIQNAGAKLKILGQGEITVAVTVRAHAVSAGARTKIEAAGGKIELIEIPKRPKRYKKREQKARTD